MTPQEIINGNKLKVLVGCEESQAVCKAFRELGHEAYSCDLQECSGGHPEWHLQMDIFEAIKLKDWDVLIAHPPCTYMSKAGARWMHTTPSGMSETSINIERFRKCKLAREFFINILECAIEHRISKIAIENPVPLKVAFLPPHTQSIQPFMFGEPFSKETLLWLIGLPCLKPTQFIQDHKPYLPSNTGGKKRGQSFHFKNISQNDSSKTFPGIAKAMAQQWGGLIHNKQQPK